MSQILVCDAIMGTGKTESAITYINNCKDKIMFVTPFLSEIERIKEGCPNRQFKEPLDDQCSKLEHCNALLLQEENIATTHALFMRMYDREIEKISNIGYTLILDETFDPYIEIKSSNKALMKCMYDASTDLGNGSYEAPNRQPFHVDMPTGRFVYNSQLGMFWEFNPNVLKCFNKVIIMTYRFKGQQLCSFFKKEHLSYSYLGVKKENGKFEYGDVSDCPMNQKSLGLKNLITVVDNQKYNQVGSNYYDLSKSHMSKLNHKDISGQIRSVFRNMGAKADDALWTTYKSEAAKILKLPHHPPKKGFIPLNLKGVNQYSDRHYLCYYVNLFQPPTIYNLYKEWGVTMDTDEYALSSLVQWVWRSAIRKGEPIMIYIPSKRMRDLFENWLEEIS